MNQKCNFRLIFGVSLLLCLSIHSKSQVIYSDPRVYNLTYSFELIPDHTTIDKTTDLRLWVPIPRDWDSQKVVKIISVQPSPHAKFEDPEHGNHMLYWDFGKEPERPSYKVEIQCRLLSYEVHTEVDPENIGSYDKTSKEYLLYTRSTHTESITPKIIELAQIAIGDETNPYLQAKRIMEYAGKKVNYKILDYVRGRGIQCLLDYPVMNERTGEEYYQGACNQKSAFFVALCRAVGIPARGVSGMGGWEPWSKEEDLKPMYEFETELSPSGLAGAQDYGVLTRHTLAEFYLPNYGWIPTDPTSGRFGNFEIPGIIFCKGRDILIGPDAVPEDGQGYGVQWVPLHNGRADLFTRAVWNIAKIRKAKMMSIHFSDPFPADALSIYPEENEEEKLKDWRKITLHWPSYRAYSSRSTEFNLDQISQDYPGIWYDFEPFICHMLRRHVGNEMFFKLIKTYRNLQEQSHQPIPTNQFKEIAETLYGESLDWFFNQWVNSRELPHLKLENVSLRNDGIEWQVRGSLQQVGERTFQFPIELAVDTKNGRRIEKLYVDSTVTDFEFRLQHKPQKLIVDPDYEVLKFQKMPPYLWWYWDVYPNYLLVYGTIAEESANRAAADRFN